MLQILSKRSSCADKRPDPANLANGELAINFNSTSSNVFYKNNCGCLNVVGAASVSAIAPNSCATGYCGNSPGEFWFDCSNSALKIWNGTCWFGISSGCSAGTVTTVIAGTGLTGGTITVSGTIALATTAVTAGTYPYACVTVDCFGRITGASCGAAPVCLSTITAKGDLIVGTGAGTISALPVGANGRVLSANSACGTGVEWVVNAGVVTCVTGTSPISVDNTNPALPVVSVTTASTSALGVTQLVDSISSTSTTCAATPASVKCAYDLANAALPKAGGTMTGALTTAATGIIFSNGTSLTRITDATDCNCSNVAASAASMNATYAVANAALQRSGGTMTGNITFNGAQTFPVSGIQDATTLQKGVVQVGSNLNVSGGVIYALSADTTQAGVVQLTNVNNSCSCSLAPTANVLRLTWNEASLAKTTADAAITVANDALPRAGGAMTGSITFAGGQTFPVSGIQDATTYQKGLVQVGTNISDASGTISVASASTSVPGIVQLNDTTASTSTTEALTANQGKSLQDQIDALAVVSNITFGGTFNASTGFVDSVTAQGTTAGLVVGNALPAPGVGNEEIFVIVDVQGTNGPNTPTLVHVGDWFLSDGTTWQFLNVGFAPGQATTSSQGVVQLATNAEVQAGTDTSNAVVSSALQSKISDSISTTSCTTIASSTAVKCAYDLANVALPGSTYSSKGALVAGTGVGTYSALGVGANGYVLTADSTCSTGLKWIENTGGVSTLTVCPTLCNLGTSSNPILCAVPAPAAVGICEGTSYGVVKLVNDVCNCSCCLAASAYAANNAYIVASLALPKSGGTITGAVTFGCSGLGCPAYLNFANGIANGCIFGISDDYATGASNVAASKSAVNTVYGIANAALPTSGGTMSSSISFSAGGICFTPTTSCITGLTSALNCDSTTLALTAAGGCCLNFIASCKLSTSGGLLTGGITFLTGAGGICFTDSSSCFLGITNSISCTSSTLAASATAVKCAYDTGAAAIPCSILTAKATLISASAASTPTALAVGTDGQVLTACAACTSGLTWAAGGGGGSGTVTSITAGTGLTGGTITTSGTVALDTACVVQPTAYTAKGTILSASAASTPSALAVGGNGCTLIANSACTTGLCWGPGSIPCSTVTAKGDLIAGTAANTFSALPVGTDGLFLTANSASATGLCWAQVGDSPVGAISFFAMCTAPTGWLVADGSCVSRSTYSALFAAVGTTYGVGDGTTTFQLPNLRGRFARGWNSTGSGCDASRVFGSCQSNCVGPHNHTLCAPPGSTTDSGSQGWTPTGGIFSTLRTSDRAAGSGDTRITSAACNVAMACAGCLIGTETRPDNIALLPCIKVGISVALDVNATPTVAGAVVGCTNNLCFNTLLGCNAGASITGVTACTTAIGACALYNATGLGNTAIGQNAGCTITTGTKNLAIGHSVAVASATASCQLAIGFSATENWLTGDSCKNITPGAGILSTAGTLGTNGQALVACANGCGVCWGTIADSTPVGSVAFFAMCTAPTGWLVADGSCVSRTTYSQLFSAVGTTYGAGNGSTTFQLPDMRGRFARGWNNCATGIDPSRAFGSCQCWATERICGTICCIAETFGIFGTSAGTSPFFRGSNLPQAGCTPTSSDTSDSGTLSFDTCRINAERFGATETRPANIAMLPCIKAGNSAALGVDATPTVAGAMTGCTNNLCHNTMLGCNAGAAVTATTACLTAVGKNALCLATGNNNTALGTQAGCAITTGTNNVIIGPNTAVASATGSCQLSIGFSATDNWLTGTSTKAIKPGAGIIDCANSCGTAGQVLVSNGSNAVCWATGAIGSWTSAGTIQSVGLGATTTAPTVNSTSKNNVSYRQLGAKDWEVVYTLTATSTLTAGSGDYLFTLPNSLSFDTTLHWQPIFTGSVGAAATVNRLYFLPGPSCSQIIFTNGNTGSAYGAAPVIYDATRFRFFATADADPAPRAVGSSWYVGTASLLAFVIRFQFTST